MSLAKASGTLASGCRAAFNFTRRRRFSYFRIASPLVAIMETIKVVAAIEVPPRSQPRSANDDVQRFARSCYDHLAGQVGSLLPMHLWLWGISFSPMRAVRSRFRARFSFLRSALILRPRARRIFCQPCLDWSERRYRIKGLVGARILDLYWSSDGSNVFGTAVHSN